MELLRALSDTPVVTIQAVRVGQPIPNSITAVRHLKLEQPSAEVTFGHPGDFLLRGVGQIVRNSCAGSNPPRSGASRIATVTPVVIEIVMAASQADC